MRYILKCDAYEKYRLTERNVKRRFNEIIKRNHEIESDIRYPRIIYDYDLGTFVPYGGRRRQAWMSLGIIIMGIALDMFCKNSVRRG